MTAASHEAPRLQVSFEATIDRAHLDIAIVAGAAAEGRPNRLLAHRRLLVLVNDSDALQWDEVTPERKGGVVTRSTTD